MRALLEILAILVFLTCLTLGGSGALEAVRWLLGRPGLGQAYWVALLGGTALLALLLALLALVGGPTVGSGR